MKKLFILICGLVSIFSLYGCTNAKLFDVSLKQGLFYGQSTNNHDCEIYIDFSEIDIMQYVKINNNKIKDLSTADTKYYTPYYVTIIFSVGIENYIIDFSEMVELNYNTTDTYKIRKINGERYGKHIDLSEFTMQLIDNDNDRIVDELSVNYVLNGKEDNVKVKYVSEKNGEYQAHYKFQYECTLTYDENISFGYKHDNLFLAGKQLVYNIRKIDGYTVAMYVNNELYKEMNSDEVETVMPFRYTTSYKNVSIEFKLVKNN